MIFSACLSIDFIQKASFLNHVLLLFSISRDGVTIPSRLHMNGHGRIHPIIVRRKFNKKCEQQYNAVLRKHQLFVFCVGRGPPTPTGEKNVGVAR